MHFTNITVQLEMFVQLQHSVCLYLCALHGSSGQCNVENCVLVKKHNKMLFIRKDCTFIHILQL